MSPENLISYMLISFISFMFSVLRLCNSGCYKVKRLILMRAADSQVGVGDATTFGIDLIPSKCRAPV